VKPDGTALKFDKPSTDKEEAPNHGIESCKQDEISCWPADFFAYFLVCVLW